MASSPSWPKTPTELTALINPELEGAACAGRAPLFDNELEGESHAERTTRHHQAANICRTCPVIVECGHAAADLPAGQRQGIWASHNLATIHSNRKASA